MWHYVFNAFSFFKSFRFLLLMKSWFPGSGVRFSRMKERARGTVSPLCYSPISTASASPSPCHGRGTLLDTPRCSSSLARFLHPNTHIASRAQATLLKPVRLIGCLMLTGCFTEVSGIGDRSFIKSARSQRCQSQAEFKKGSTSAAVFVY